MTDSLLLMLGSNPTEQDLEQISKINEVLSKIHMSLKIKNSTYEEKQLHHLVIEYDMNDVRKAITRNAGRIRKGTAFCVTPMEIRERMKTESAEEIAQSLGISRSTLFRKLKNAEEYNQEFL